LEAGGPNPPGGTVGEVLRWVAGAGGGPAGAGAHTPPACVDQDEATATYADKIGPEDRALDPARSPVELERTVRALHPHIGARLAVGEGEWLGVHAAAAVDEAARPAPGEAAAPGSAAGLPPAGALAVRDG